MKREAYKSRRKNQKELGRKKFMSFNVDKKDQLKEDFANVYQGPELVIEDQQDSIFISTGKRSQNRIKFKNQNIISKTEYNTQRSLAKSQTHMMIENRDKSVGDFQAEFDTVKIESPKFQNKLFNQKFDNKFTDKFLEAGYRKESITPKKEYHYKEGSKESYSNKKGHSENQSISKSPRRYPNDLIYIKAQTQGAKHVICNSNNNINVSNLNHITNLNNTVNNLRDISRNYGKSR